MGRVLVSTVWEDPRHVMLCIHKLCIDRAIILVDSQKKESQSRAVKKVKEIEKAYRGILDLSTESIELYNIPKITEKCIQIIDSLPKGDEIFVNVTGGRKTQCLGLVFASYLRHGRIRGIYYVTEEGDSFIQLPKLKFDLSVSQKELLDVLAENRKYKTMNELSELTTKSRPMLYKNLRELEEMGMVGKEEQYYITEAGRIARLYT